MLTDEVLADEVLADEVSADNVSRYKSPSLSSLSRIPHNLRNLSSGRYVSSRRAIRYEAIKAIGSRKPPWGGLAESGGCIASVSLLAYHRESQQPNRLSTRIFAHMPSNILASNPLHLG